MPSHADFARYRGRHKRRRSEGRRRTRRPQLYRVTDFVVAYLLALAILFATAAVSPMFAFFAYFVIGVFLSRFIGERVDWWIITASIKNVAAVKFHTILTWPVSVPVFVLRVFVAKFF